MTAEERAFAGEGPGLNGRHRENPVDWLIRVWDEVLTDETRRELAELPDDWLDQLDHYTYGTPKKPVLKYE